MTRRFELDEQISLLQGRHKAELLPLNEEMNLCEQFIKAELIKSGAQSWKSATTGHNTYWTTKDSVTVEDMDAVIHRILAEAPAPDTLPIDAGMWNEILEHIQRFGLWGLLNKAVNKITTREIIESGSPVPGVKFTTFKDLSWRRGKRG